MAKSRLRYVPIDEPRQGRLQESLVFPELLDPWKVNGKYLRQDFTLSLIPLFAWLLPSDSPSLPTQSPGPIQRPHRCYPLLLLWVETLIEITGSSGLCCGAHRGLEKHYLTTLQTENPKSLRQAILALKPYKDPTFLLLTFVFIALALDKLGYQLCDSHLCVCCHTGSSCVSVLTGHLIWQQSCRIEGLFCTRVRYGQLTKHINSDPTLKQSYLLMNLGLASSTSFMRKW